MLVNSSNFKEIIGILRVNVFETDNDIGSITVPFTRLKGRHYCWTRGNSHNYDYTGVKYKNSSDDQVTTAVRNSKLGGTDRDTTTRTEGGTASKIKIMDK